MPFPISLPNRVLSKIKKEGTQAINLLSVALYRATTDVDGEISITFDTPYSVESSLFTYFSRVLDISGMTAEERQAALQYVQPTIISSDNTQVTVAFTRYITTEAKAPTVGTVVVVTEGSEAAAGEIYDILVVEADA